MLHYHFYKFWSKKNEVIMKYFERIVKFVLTISLLMLLYISSTYNYLLFHSLAEVFSICIAIAVFLITLNSVRFLQNKYLLIVGIAYLFIGFLDLFHTLSYQGMMIFTDYDFHANQLWIAARYFESIVLLISLYILNRKSVWILIFYSSSIPS
jgi:hypothetical protein